MKKNLLFIMNNLNCGGAEKSLISLLQTIDYSEYDVDLLLFKHEGIFMNKLPSQVKLLREPSNYKYFDMSIKKASIECAKRGRLDIVLFRIIAGYIFKTEKSKAKCEQKVWKCMVRIIGNIDKRYDVAIGYLEKNPIYYCVDKVNSVKKIGFIHNDYDKLGMDPTIDMKYFNKLNSIVTVSEECANVLKKRFPSYKQRVKVMYNIVSPDVINKISLEEVDIKHKDVTLVSVGRLSYQKGFDMAIEACKILVNTGCDIKWYVLGEGEERIKLEEMIKENNLQDRFILLGVKENPYPYIRQANIYVQPSRFEGKSIAVDEAKILNKAIVVTNFSTAKDQIENEVNGLIVKMAPECIAMGIERLIKDNKLRQLLSENLSKESIGNEDEIVKLYEMINE